MAAGGCSTIVALRWCGARQAAGLEKDVVFTGDMQRFRIWSRPEWQRYDEIAAKDKAKVLTIPGLWL